MKKGYFIYLHLKLCLSLGALVNKALTSTKCSIGQLDCNFEEPCDWLITGHTDSVSWMCNKGDTTTPNTGPSMDRTKQGLYGLLDHMTQSAPFLTTKKIIIYT